MNKNEIYSGLEKLFDQNLEEIGLITHLRESFEILKGKLRGNQTRFSKSDNFDSNFISSHSSTFENGESPKKILEFVVGDLFSEVPRWGNPNFQYNVGTAVNNLSVAVYSLALQENIYAINEGLAGKSILAEKIVTNILTKSLLDENLNSAGLFTFGGTATNLYAMKLGLNKSDSGNSNKGVRNINVAITSDAHFSHNVCIDWLGIGKDNSIILDRAEDLRSDLNGAEMKFRKSLEGGNTLASIIINGGTTYNHIIDDIRGFSELRDKLVEEYGLSYKPHLHVDSVIGWAWLFFKGYDFNKNDLGINLSALDLIEKQCNRISELNLADSWGVDFHKGVGSCPVNSSIFIMNDKNDMDYLSKKSSSETHQLAGEKGGLSPVDFTLETSRSAGPPLAALTALKVLGANGYRRNLSNLIENTIYMREKFAGENDIFVCDSKNSLGFVTMLRLYPKLNFEEQLGFELTHPSSETFDISMCVNNYLDDFFKWDSENRMSQYQGVEYSFSSKYMTLSNGASISAIKLYPSSPHFNKEHALSSAKSIIHQKKVFDLKNRGKYEL